VPAREDANLTGNEPARRILAARQALKERRIDAAATIAGEVLLEQPDNLDALEVKALVAVAHGDDDTAEGRLLLRLKRNTDAEAVTRAALAADAQNPDAHAMLASMLAERELWVDAADHFERAISLVGDHPQLLTGLGHARMRSGRLDEARRLLEAATQADPDALEPAVYLAELEERLGHFEDAERQLDRAEQVARKQGTDVDLQRSVLLARMNEPERALALLDGRQEFSGAARLQRGRLYDRLGRHAEAWNDWVAGKAQLAERNGRRYPAEEVAGQARSLAAFFNPTRTAQLPRAARRDEVPQPIFIIGFPRSGTTLVEQILASHGAIAAGGELPFGPELRELASSLDGSGAAFPETLAAAQPNWPDRLRDFYLERAQGYGLLSGGAGYFTDKMPSNDFWLPLLRVAFPESPVIFMRRHPLDILTSVMAHDMTHGFHCGYRLEDAARHLALVDGLLHGYSEGGVGPTFELRYESLVADQAGETERLMGAIGMPMEPGQLTFHERAEVSPTPSYAQVREPLNDRSIGRWRNYAAQLEPARGVVANVMARGGYAP
jgi:tetratricopeptide (TPR) repeat protein